MSVPTCVVPTIVMSDMDDDDDESTSDNNQDVEEVDVNNDESYKAGRVRLFPIGHKGPYTVHA